MVLAPDLELSRAELDLLSRGLTFVPTVDLGLDQKNQLELDLQNYHRKIKLAVYFGNTPRPKRFRPFVGPSTWSPLMCDLPPQIQQLINTDLKTFKNDYKFIEERSNISLEEIKILKNLKNSKKLVLKPADKGSAIVILSREQYILEVERQLNDKVYYQKLKEPIYMKTIPMILNILDQLKKKKFITERQRQYLGGGSSQPRERRFYILPKIHKDPKTWTVPFQVPPGRPIVSDCGSETYFTAEYLEHFLNPISIKHPSYIKDTYDFIKLVNELVIPQEFYFFSMDVESLYTNIPIERGIECVRKAFNKYPDKARPDDELIDLLRINLTRNDFVFNNEFYLQIKGTAMGKRFAPSYANIYMANWEEEALAKCEKKPFCYLRYLDDIWGIWTGTLKEFDKFLDTLNSHDSSIKLKSEINKDSIQFLDTTIFKGPQYTHTHRLDIKVFFKTTDTHALLHRHSFHPTHTFKGIVKAQLLRFHRICTQKEDFEEAVKILYKALRQRGYTRTFLKACLRDFDQPIKKIKNNQIPIITTFSTASRNLNWKWKDNYDKILTKSNLISNYRTISAYRRNQNLKDWLTNAKLKSIMDTKRKKPPDNFHKLKFIRGNRDQLLYRIGQNISFKTKNCIYFIYCNECNLKYVGETKNEVFLRIQQHKNNIRNLKKLDIPLVKHFLEHGLNNLKWGGLESNINWTDWERKKRERYWIYVLGTRAPGGLNIKKN